MLSAQTKGYILLGTGRLWIGAVAFVVCSNLILRETPLGVIAREPDKVPSPLYGILFLACWAGFFLGWAVPIFYAVRLLGCTAKQANGPTHISG